MSYYEEPFPFVVYRNLKERIENGQTESELATAYAYAATKVTGLRYQLEDPDYSAVIDKVEQSLAMWEELEEQLLDSIRQILREENEHGETHQLEGIGTHWIVKPFMERNGYRDVSGWWMKSRE